MNLPSPARCRHPNRPGEVTQDMRLVRSVLLYGIIGVLGCAHVESQQESNSPEVSTATDVAAHATL